MRTARPRPGGTLSGVGYCAVSAPFDALRYDPGITKDPRLTEVSTARAIVIATPDAKTRARCVVHLASSADTIVSAADFKAPHIADSIRATATILIAQALLPADAAQWHEVITDHGWHGRRVVLGSQGSEADPHLEDITYLPDPLDLAQLIAAV